MIWMLLSSHHPPQFLFDNTKITLVLAEMKDEGRVVVRLVFTASQKIENLLLTAFIPFKVTGNPTLRQDRLLDRYTNKRIGLSMIFGNDEFFFYDVRGRKLVVREDNGNEREIIILKKEEIEISRLSFVGLTETYPVYSFIRLRLRNPIKSGTYAISFAFDVEEMGREFFEHSMFEKGTSIEIPIFHECEARENTLKEIQIQQSIVDPRYVEFFLITPSYVVASRPKPQQYQYRSVEYCEAQVSAFRHEYESHRGSNQFRWIFGHGGGLVTLNYLKLPVTSIFLFYTIIILDLEIGIYLFGTFDITPEFSLSIFVFWILLLNYLAFSLIKKPSVLAALSRTVAEIGYSNFFWQIIGCFLFISLESLLILVERWEVSKSPWSFLGLGFLGFFCVILLELLSQISSRAVERRLLKLNPSKWEVIEYAILSWNFLLISMAATISSFAVDLLRGLGLDVLSGWYMGITAFISLCGIGMFGGKLVEVLEERFVVHDRHTSALHLVTRHAPAAFIRRGGKRDDCLFPFHGHLQIRDRFRRLVVLARIRPDVHRVPRIPDMIFTGVTVIQPHSYRVQFRHFLRVVAAVRAGEPVVVGTLLQQRLAAE